MPAWLGWAIPAAISGASALYGALKKPPSTPQYKPSKWEQDYYTRLQDILEGRSPGFTGADIERQYQGYKDRMLPEYSRLRKEQGTRFARRGIEGGPVTSYERKLGEHQFSELAQARRKIEDETRRLEEGRKMSALQGMGGLAQSRSLAESQRQIMEYKAQLQQYKEMQQALADLMGVSGTFALQQAFPQQQPSTTGQGGTTFESWKEQYLTPNQFAPSFSAMPYWEWRKLYR